MKLVPVDKEKVNGCKKPKLGNILEEFIKSGEAAANVVYSDGEYTSPTSACNSFRDAIRRYKYSGTVSVKVKDGKLYLLNKLLFDKED